jgi:hypothetical protein
MCGMAPLDPDDPYLNIFQCDPTRDFDTHIDSKFYTSKIQPTRVKTFSHCADKYDSPVELDIALKAPDRRPYSVVLPICEECIANGCRVVVRAAKHIVHAKQVKMDKATDNACVTRTTRSKASQNSHKPRNT